MSPRQSQPTDHRPHLDSTAWRHISGNLVSGVLPGTPHPRAFVPVRGTFQGRSGNVFLSLLRPNWFTCIAHDYWNPERADQHGAITTLEE